MIVAITGGTGFIGLKLALKHLNHGDTVRVLTRDASIQNDHIEFYYGDLSNPQIGYLRQFLKGVDVLYHCACEINNPDLMEEVNVKGTQRLIEAATGTVKHFVYLSSVGVYGKHMDGIVNESAKKNPQNTYERSKVKAEELIHLARKQKRGFTTTILRPSNVYGPGMSNQSLYQMISMINKGLFFYIGKPMAFANYVHVNNVVEALFLCGTNPVAEGKHYIISDRRTMEVFVGMIANALDVTPPKLRIPEKPLRLIARLLGRFPRFPLTENRIDALTTRVIYNSTQIQNDLGYHHILSMGKGIEDLVRDWQKKGL